MAKRVFLIHGWEGSPDEGWRPWLQEQLEDRGFAVKIPAMPDTKHPTIEAWVPFLQQAVGIADDQTYFVCHSLGCITVIRYLESLASSQHVGGSVFIAGFGNDLNYEGYNGELASFFRTPINWEKVKRVGQKFVVIHSEDDPWVAVDQAKNLAEKLGVEPLLVSGFKHFSGDDGVTELPLALEAIVKMAQ